MNVLDRARVEKAVFTYDLWLDARGIHGQRRRDLRRELRANLLEASADRGARPAVAALGSIRDMAREAGAPDRTRPRWTSGLAAAVTGFVVVTVLIFFAGVAWVEGARAASPNGPVTGSIALFPGSSVEYRPGDGESMAFVIGPGWGPLAAGLAMFVAVARPWRLVTGGRAGGRAGVGAVWSPRGESNP